jgi:predicted transcriptional regulator of viral defense system
MRETGFVRFKRAKRIFRRHGGILRSSEAIRQGIGYSTLYAMRDGGILEQLSRGLYRLADLPPLGNPDLVAVSRKVPSGVLCLISALAYHGITTQIPSRVHLALKRGAEPPRVDYPPVQVYWFTGEAFTAGIETHDLEGTPLRVYSPEKTLADCFKYRNKIGVGTAIEALKMTREKKRFNVEEIIRYARICRVEKIMTHYLQALS